MPEISPLLNPVAQFGFAGFATLLLAAFLWLVKNLIRLQQETIVAVRANTEAITLAIQELKAQSKLLDDVRTQFLRRPCIANNND